MKNYTFHWEVKNLIIQFLKALDDSVVKRYDENKDVHQDIEVSVKYSPKSRTMHHIINKQEHISFPIISAWITGITRDQSRVFNKIDGPTFMDEETNKPLQPIPVDIAMSVSMVAKYQNDMDQMICNFVPYFDPYIILSWQHPIVESEIRSEVLWSGNISYKYPVDTTATDAWRVMADTNFTIKGWLFKAAQGNSGIIHTITSDFIGVKEIDIEFDRYSEFKEEQQPYDTFTVSGIPTVTSTDEIWIKQEGGNMTAHGNLIFPEQVFLSGDMLSGEMSLIEPFSGSELSGANPPFYGMEISGAEKTSDTSLNITIPELDNTGFLDIIVLNEAGYGSLVRNADDESSQKNGLFVI